MNPPDSELPPVHASASAGASVRRKRWVMLAMLVAAAAGAWYGGWYIAGQKTGDLDSKKKAAPIIIMPVARADVPLYMSALGTVQAFNTVTVRPRVDGELMALQFTEGQMVHKGDVLALIDDRVLKAQRDQAAANVARDAATLANARRDLARYQHMGDSIPRQTLETQEASVKEAEATLASDKAALENAQTQLSYATILSPLDGRTGIRAVDVGNIVHASDTNGIVTVTQIEPITVIFSLPQQHLPLINAQINAGEKLTVDALDGDTQKVIDRGVLELVDNEIDQTTGTIKLKATFPNQTHALWPGGFTNIRLLLTTHANAMTIPTVAVQHGPKGAYVFRYEPEEKQVSIVPVTVGVVNGEQSEIIDGLRDGDKVVTDGMAKLQDKTKVRLSKSSHVTPSDAVKETPPSEKPADVAAPEKTTDDATTESPAVHDLSKPRKD